MNNKSYTYIIITILLVFITLLISDRLFDINDGVSMNARVGVVFDEPFESVDPASIKNLSQAFVVRNLYAPILDYDENAQIVSGIAENFRWIDNKLIISFGRKSITKSGYVVGAEDALISIKRLIILGKNTHGSIAEFVCDKKPLKSIYSDCEGLSVIDNQLVIEVKKESQKEQLMTLLSSVDYRIIPKIALDLNSLKIVNFTETSGPFRFESTQGNSTILRSNDFNYLFTVQMPKYIELIQIKGKNVIDIFINNEIDIIPSFIPLTKSDIERLNNSKISFNVDKTHNISVAMWVFSKKAQIDFTPEMRFKISNDLFNLLGDNANAYSEHTVQFFQDFGEGFLNTNQVDQIIKTRSSKFDKVKLTRRPKIAVRGFLNKNADSFFSAYNEYERVNIDTHPLNLSENERPDVFFGMADVAYKSTYSIMSYYIKYGVFGIFDIEADSWLEKYSELDDQSLKNEMINDLHFRALKNSACFPISVGPYLTITRNGWQSRMNKYFSITRLWTLWHEK